MDIIKTICLNIAGFYIKINFHEYEWELFSKIFIESIQNYYSNYLVDNQNKKTDFNIEIFEEKDLLLNKNKKNHYFIEYFNKTGKNRITSYYHISLNQFQLVLREVLIILIKGDGFMIHASAAEGKDGAIIFFGKSGDGKSTVVNFIKDDFFGLADDTGIIRKVNKKYFFYQTPFFEKNNWIIRSNKKYPIDKIFFIKKADFFKIDKIIERDLNMKRILEQIWVREKLDNNQIKKVFNFVAVFKNFYELSFAKDKNNLIKLIHEIQN
jgi:hypothetical protein